jgi:hypothetical protein
MANQWWIKNQGSSASEVRKADTNEKQIISLAAGTAISMYRNIDIGKRASVHLACNKCAAVNCLCWEFSLPFASVYILHCKKWLTIFPSPAGMALAVAGNN